MKLGSAGTYPPGTLVRDTTGAEVVVKSTDNVVAAAVLVEDKESVLVEKKTLGVLVDETGDDEEDVEEDVDVDGEVEDVALGVDEVVEVTTADSVLVADTAGIVDEASIEAGTV